MSSWSERSISRSLVINNLPNAQLNGPPMDQLVQRMACLFTEQLCSKRTERGEKNEEGRRGVGVGWLVGSGVRGLRLLGRDEQSERMANFMADTRTVDEALLVLRTEAAVGLVGVSDEVREALGQAEPANSHCLQRKRHRWSAEDEALVFKLFMETCIRARLIKSKLPPGHRLRAFSWEALQTPLRKYIVAPWASLLDDLHVRKGEHRYGQGTFTRVYSLNNCAPSELKEVRRKEEGGRGGMWCGWEACVGYTAIC
ncbi:hypothetical protein niasHT_008316 [Heterodera trifolii]|uniref:Uncharacterized protein n=1 Tax=Heterodera trifolii TaxID=157864 RepID=A0ABD2M1J7_9BILA